ncbi:MAG: glycosyltransferase family 4 protein [Candidatus Eisenbacteria sp.]|nr:glycosyltransferase family 4 protein [Candidatus Eisenbacteria bacterium]
MNPGTANPVSKIAVIGNYLPRQCGIATFTTNLCDHLAREMRSGESVIAVAMNDKPEGYAYPARVEFTVRADVQEDYYWAAEFLNAGQYELAILQHEYGIFGGKAGAYIFHMLKALRMPILTNLHTVLEDPTPEQKLVIDEIARYSARLVVMSRKAEELLNCVYGVAPAKIVLIPHGIPDATFEASGVHNDLLGVEGRDVVLTFGLLSPGKGIENMIKALPAITKAHPKVIYIVLGQTHPHVRAASGDSYRHGLQQLARSLGVRDHLLFQNSFVEDEMLVRYLQTAKIYVTPYLNKEQITSGTLAYALGCGAAIVSTPFLHAQELLANGCGRIVPFNDPDGMGAEIIDLLRDDRERESMRLRAYQRGRSMTHKEVARQHLRLVADVREEGKYTAEYVDAARQNFKALDELPEIDLAHLRMMTDDTGILQHARYCVPDRNHGYCLDDNARALIVACMYYSLHPEKRILVLLETYLSFVHYAFNPENDRFRNFMSYERQWLEAGGSEDAHGRALWALGTAVKYAPNESVRRMAMLLFVDGLRVVESFTSPRAWSFAIIGLHTYLEKYSGDASARSIRTKLARRLFGLFMNNASEEWPWCEDRVTYANARLPQAMILAGQWIPDPEMFAAGERALAWLLRIQTADEGHISVIGNGGWYGREGQESSFDQQPVELMGLIDACLELYVATGKKKWRQEAERCLGWYLGRNDLDTQVYDFETGGCRDGLQRDGVNANEGAESTLSWLISLLRMYEVIGMGDLSGSTLGSICESGCMDRRVDCL